MANPFAEDHSQDAPSVGKRPEIRLAMDSARFETRNLRHPQARAQSLDGHLGLDLEPVSIEVEPGQDTLPEGDVAVAEIRVAPAEQQTNDAQEGAVADPSQTRHVRCTCTLSEPCAF